MKITEELLRDLARLAETDRSVLSSYIDLRTGWDKAESALEKRAKKLRPLLTDNEKEYFDVSLSLLQEYLDEKKSTGYDGYGLAYFADIGADYSAGIELNGAVEQLLAVDDEAIIAPLALQLDEYEPVGVIMADGSGARIFIVSGQRIDEEGSLKTKIHHLSKVGGWSQMRYQRRRDNEIGHFAKETVAAAEAIFQREGVKRIIFAGRDRILKAIEEELPKQWRDAKVDILKWDLDSPDDEFLSRVRPAIERAEREQEKRVLDRFVGELRRGGLAMAGAEAVLAALALGQVDTLILNFSVERELTEELTSLAEAMSAHVEFVPSGNDVLDSAGGVGALLRYKR